MTRAGVIGAALLCASLAGGAVWLAWPTRPAVFRLRRLASSGSGRGGTSSRAGPGTSSRARPVLAGGRVGTAGGGPGGVPGRLQWRPQPELLVVAAGAGSTLVTGYLTPLLFSPIVALLVRRWRRGNALQRDAAIRRAQVRRFCVALSAELRAGRPPREAVAGAATVATGGSPGLAEVIRAASSGGELTDALRAAGAAPGAEGLRRVAACWLVAEHHGAGLAAAIDRLADGLHEEESQRQEVAAQLAGARATGRLLAVLPAFGLLLGSGLGAHPVRILLGTPYGLCCLLVGAALDVTGLIWTERLARAAEGGP
jgi:tight adherence protein B